MLDFIQSRQSTPILTSPAPSQSEWETIIQCAMTAPDHGRLKPWRFFLIEGEGRNALGEVFLESLNINGKVSDAITERTLNLPLRAPAVLTLAAKILHDHKIPAVEQISATAAACQNIQLALKALGYGCMWRTGDFAYDDHVKASFKLEPSDEIIGFLYIGTIDKEPPARHLPEVSTCFSHWTEALN